MWARWILLQHLVDGDMLSNDDDTGIFSSCRLKPWDMSWNRRGGGWGGSITRSCRRMRSSRGMFCHENDLRLGTVTPLESTHTIAQKKNKHTHPRHSHYDECSQEILKIQSCLVSHVLTSPDDDINLSDVMWCAGVWYLFAGVTGRC